MHDIHHKFIVFTRDRVGKPTVIQPLGLTPYDPFP